MNQVQTCRKCGCTEEIPCLTQDGPCHWIQADLCNACAHGFAEPCLHPADISALANSPPVAIQLAGPQAMLLLSLIQLAVRHPAMGVQPSAQFGRELGRAIQDKIAVTPNCANLFEAGWRKDNEENQPQSRLIVPPGFGQ